MTKQELINELTRIAETYNGKDQEAGHVHADEALLAYINDDDVTVAYSKIEAWYS